MAFDFKKEYKDVYLPKTNPVFIDVPEMSYIAIIGQGDPNEEDGAYKQAIAALYALSFTIKMSKMGDWQPKGYFDYVVPPLEGLWWTNKGIFDGLSNEYKSAFHWIAMIRQPDFVTDEVFTWAKGHAIAKKPEIEDVIEKARLIRFSEGPCVQIMHLGPYDDEASSIEKLNDYIFDTGYTSDLSNTGDLIDEEVLETFIPNNKLNPIRLHHEIYLSDPRRCKPENLKTVIRQPVS